MALAGGCGCHSTDGGAPGAGGRELATTFGTFYSTNITADPKRGIGAWTDAEIERAIRGGVLPDGSSESPVMPYYRYSGMADRDVADLIAYLRTLPAAADPRPEASSTLPLPRFAFRAWRLLYAPTKAPPADAPGDPVEYGRYLVDHVAICGDCHTPRNLLGAPRKSMYMAGAKEGPLGQNVPNITPHATGIGAWEADDIENLLRLGMLPNFDSVQGLMAEVVDGFAGSPGYGDAGDDAIDAIVAYMETVPAIENQIKTK